MKIKHLILLTFIFSIVSQSLFAQTRRALIFAIGNYPAESGWRKISSINDIPFIDTALQRNGFKEKDIKIVRDDGATIGGITRELNDLITRSNPNDIVVIHFSSHGEQLKDRKGGNKSDGLEESVVSYGAIAPPLSGVTSTNEEYLKLQAAYLRDDQFGSYVDKLRTKLGNKGEVVIFMDLCHAGTGTRGLGKVRGGLAPLVPPGFYDQNYKSTDEYKPVLPLTDEKNMAPYVVIAAARATELDNETYDDNYHEVGSLSYAVSKAFTKLDSSTTYRTLFANIQSIMNGKTPQQHPVLSGNGQDNKLFGKGLVNQKPFIAISDISGNEMTLKGGKFVGLDVGAKIAVYPAGTNDPRKSTPLATGTITKADLYDSWAELDKDPGLQQAALGWVFITDQVFITPSLNVGIVNNISAIANKTRGNTSGGFSQKEVLNMQKALLTLPSVKIGDKPELNIAKGKDGSVDSIIVSSTGLVFDTIRNIAQDTAQLNATIRDYIQYQFLKNLNVPDPDINLEVKLVPVKNKRPDTSKIHLANIDYSFTKGDSLMIWVNNKSLKNVYFNILDLQPNGVINPILPHKFPKKGKGILPEDLLVLENTSHLYENYIITISPPYGKEIFKIFASDDVIDMEDIARSRGARNGTKRGNLHPFVQLVQTSYKSRGGESTNVSDANGTAYNLFFDIKETKKDTKDKK